jgi:hypothetical protein
MLPPSMRIILAFDEATYFVRKHGLTALIFPDTEIRQAAVSSLHRKSGRGAFANRETSGFHYDWTARVALWPEWSGGI